MDHNIITFQTRLRGYHEYQIIWRPYIRQFVEFRQEQENIHDNFAVTGYATLPGIARTCVVGHMPRELSRHIWFALDLGARVIGKVIFEQFRLSPLLQGGLEIPVEIKVEWENETALHILKEKVSSLNVQEVYKGDSKEILREILAEDHDVDEEDADDFEVEVQEEIDEDNGVSTASNEVDDEEDNNKEDSDDGIIQKRKVPRIFNII